MNVSLNAIEARVIGSLMEKSMLTPEQYPLSLNALVAACNQKSSRDPVMSLSEGEVAATLTALQRRYLVREKSGAGGRVPRYHYRLYNDEIGDFRFSSAERAVMCLLLLRGPQTPGELRSRSGRLHEFVDVSEVERTLSALAGHQEGPFVRRLPRQPGRREARYAELFTAAPADQGAPVADPATAGVPPRETTAPGSAASGEGAAPGDTAPAGRENLEERLARLERRVEALEAALAFADVGREADA